MDVRTLAAAALLIFASTSSLALDPQPSSANSTQVTSQEALAITALQAQIVALNAQTAEMRRSEDRLLQTVLAALGVVGTMAVGLVAFSWWQAKAVHAKDLVRVRDEVLEQVQTTQASTFLQVKQQLAEDYGRALADAHLGAQRQLFEVGASYAQMGGDYNEALDWILRMQDMKLSPREQQSALGQAKQILESAIKANRPYFVNLKRLNRIAEDYQPTNPQLASEIIYAIDQVAKARDKMEKQ